MMMNEELEVAQRLTSERLERYTDSPFFLYAKRELDRVIAREATGFTVDQPFYESLNIGLMCARELEPIDPEFCNVIYAMLETIRPK